MAGDYGTFEGCETRFDVDFQLSIFGSYVESYLRRRRIISIVIAVFPINRAFGSGQNGCPVFELNAPSSVKDGAAWSGGLFCTRRVNNRVQKVPIFA